MAMHDRENPGRAQINSDFDTAVLRAKNNARRIQAETKKLGRINFLHDDSPYLARAHAVRIDVTNIL
jgi:hypothetical protein